MDIKRIEAKLKQEAPMLVLILILLFAMLIMENRSSTLYNELSDRYDADLKECIGNGGWVNEYKGNGNTVNEEVRITTSSIQ